MQLVAEVSLFSLQIVTINITLTIQTMNLTSLMTWLLSVRILPIP
ncbi:hypothetical protein L380_00637 [Enterobacter roggenkampii MGH 34]|nr:hypothetical protein L380_00637 [Enterobacter roggenkampii MGH 34]